MRNIDKLSSNPKRCMHTWQLYPLLKEQGLMRVESRLNDEGGKAVINGVTVHVLSKVRAQSMASRLRKQFVHRCYMICDCGSEVPVGRTHQHKCKG